MAESTERVVMQIAISSSAAVAGATQVVGATDKIQTGAKGADDAIVKLESKMTLLGKAAIKLAAPITALFSGFAAARGIGRGVDVIVQFEEQLGILSGVTRKTGEDLEALAGTARQFGATTRFTATEAAEGLTLLARAGFSAKESTQALNATLNLAIAGQIGLGQSANFTSSIIAQFGLQASEANRVVDGLVIVSNRANTNVSQLAQAMSFAGPVAAALGINMEDTAASIGALGDAGIKGTRAGRNFRGILVGLTAPTTGAQKVFERLGVSLEEIDPLTNDLVDVFDRLKEAELSAGDAATIFGRENVAAALVLQGTTDSIIALRDAQVLNTGEAQKFADTLDDTLTGALLQLKSAISEASLQLGDAGLKGTMRGAIDTSTDLVRALTGIEEEGEELGTTMKVTAEFIRIAGTAFAVAVSVQAVTTLVRLVRNTQALGKAVVLLNSALIKNPITALAFAATFAIVEIRSMTNALGGTSAAIKGMREDVFDFKNAIDQLEGLEGVVNRAFAVGEPALIKRSFENVRNVLVTQAEALSREAEDGRIELDLILAALPASIAKRIKLSTSGIEQLAMAERRQQIKLQEDRKAFFIQSQNELTGLFDGKKIMQLTALIIDADAQLKTLADAPIGTALVPRTAALALVEQAIRDISVAINDQQDVIDTAASNRNAFLPAIDTKELDATLAKMQTIRDELNKQIDLVGLNNSEAVLYENNFKALTAASNLPLHERFRFLIEILGTTQTLLDLQRDNTAGSVVAAERETIELLKLRNSEQFVAAELMKTEIELRRQGIELLPEERKELTELIEERLRLQDVTSGKKKTSEVESLFRELELEKSLIGLTNDERERSIALRRLEDAAVKEQVPDIEALTDAYRRELVELQKMQEMEAIGRQVGNAVGGALEDIVLEAKSAEEAIESLIKTLIQLAFRQIVTAQIASLFGDIFSGLGSTTSSTASGGGGGGGTHDVPSFALGGAFSGGYQVRMARGDILTGPTSLRSARGPVLGGEAGPEAIMPLGRDSQGRLGIRSAGGGGSTKTFNLQFVFPGVTDSTGFDESARQAEQRIARTVQRAGG